jgi:hypothetical protein
VRREERRLAAGHTYEPRTIVERRNWSVAGLLPRTAPVLAILSPEERVG